MDSPIRILICEDHPLFREGLRLLLTAEPDLAVVGEAGSGEEAVNLVRELAPDILLLDMAMPISTGLDAMRELANSSSSVRTILLTAAIERADIIKALQLGARGVVLKDSATPELLLRSIRSVMAGEYWVGGENAQNMIEALRELVGPYKPQVELKNRFGLTARELQIIALVVGGRTNKDIARKFSIREDTVKHHLSNIFDKIGSSNRLELALFAVRHHLIDNITA